MHISASKLIPTSMPAGGSTAVRALCSPWLAEQHEPDNLDEAEQRERCRRCQTRERNCASKRYAERLMERDVKQGLKHEPLGREAVQRRQPRDRHTADQERAARPRHPAQQATEVIQIEAAGGPLQRTGTEEQQGLEDGVVCDMQQRRRERDRGPCGVARPGRTAGTRRGRAR